MSKKDLIDMYLDLITKWKEKGIGNKGKFGTIITEGMITQLEIRLKKLTANL